MGMGITIISRITMYYYLPRFRYSSTCLSELAMHPPIKALSGYCCGGGYNLRSRAASDTYDVYHSPRKYCAIHLLKFTVRKTTYNGIHKITNRTRDICTCRTSLKRRPSRFCMTEIALIFKVAFNYHVLHRHSRIQPLLFSPVLYCMTI